jgi:hypothetical protein
MNHAIFNVPMRTVVYADPLEDQLVIGLATKTGDVYMHLLSQSIADRQERAVAVSTGGWSPETSTYQEDGLFHSKLLNTALDDASAEGDYSSLKATLVKVE